MKVVCVGYFQEPEGVWHQPGSTWDVDENHRRLKVFHNVIPYAKAVAKGIPIIEAAAVEQPEKPIRKVTKRTRR